MSISGADGAKKLLIDSYPNSCKARKQKPTSKSTLLPVRDFAYFQTFNNENFKKINYIFRLMKKKKEENL